MAGFESTDEPLVPETISPHDQTLVNRHGSIRGLRSAKGGNSRDFLPLPKPLTAAQIASPTQAMIDDTDATYQLNVAPWDRYRSDGTDLIPLGGSGGVVGTISNFCGSLAAEVPVGAQAIFYDTLTVKEDASLTVKGEARVGPWPFGS